MSSRLIRKAIVPHLSLSEPRRSFVANWSPILPDLGSSPMTIVTRLVLALQGMPPIDYFDGHIVRC